MPRAVLDTDPRTEADHIGYLRFEAPDGRIDVIEVTDGPSFDRWPEKPQYQRGPVWHIDIEANQVALDPIGIMLRRGDGTEVVIAPQVKATITPSIDVKDRYHTEARVLFELVDKL